ncbi:ferrous iron transport protein B [Leptotrichia sp. OH3620_COT-345]|uniref:ferrous iron transport protein B n=1 Tax=Leptotrichia sp. OH3620_COT-345 TaxID=2491048 RepID=UPI000F6497B3|nr:ferrous iron transport protein B [Leptotrichia sp. OH3620_COT-345]RRD37941.1 ferrous iron transport protein B [Leptotrichia sp. OH3620_COT-345]
MSITIALAGNPNSGKTTLFNALTGSNQYVGNWPGVTVEKKTGLYKKNKEIKITDLPGIYSLSPYTPEEIISREYLINEKPDVILNIVDASNIERNLYLSTQLSEIGIPMVIVFNMMDVVEKNGDKIDTNKLEEVLGCPIIEISALKNRNIDKVIEKSLEVSKKKNQSHIKSFNNEIEKIITKIENIILNSTFEEHKRWYAVKLFERDEKSTQKLNLSEAEKKDINEIIEKAESDFGDDGEGIITDARYTFISDIMGKTLSKGRKGLTMSDKVDKLLTNRILALPIFVIIMFLVYYVSITVVGGGVTDWVNDTFFGEIVGGNAANLLEKLEVAPWLSSLVVDGIIGGIGAVLGFLPIITTLYIFMAILEDIGYMSRIAFILDRIFRKFGLSGKSFIPILIGTGCSVPGIMATRTIENESDRRMTIIVASFMPCGAKTEIIALFSASIFAGYKGWWFAPVCYFAGILAVAVSGIILKKTRNFSGNPAPFVMELPEYHLPLFSNIARTVWDRVKAFIIKAGTVILLASIVIWFLQNISTNFEFVEFSEGSHSILETIGRIIAPVFAPAGFGHWAATVATMSGLVAKEVVVSTFGVVAGLGDAGADDPAMIEYANSIFTPVSALSFMLFNQLCIPCFAAVGAIREEMNSGKWTWFTITYQMLFSYAVALIVFQLGNVFVLGENLTVWTFVAAAVLIFMLYMMFKKVQQPGEIKKIKTKEVNV